jgi:hypothetical protein
MNWLDGPFFTMIDQITGTLDTFQTYGFGLGVVVMFFSVMMLAVKLVLGGRLEGEIMKRIFMYAVFLILMHQYKNILDWCSNVAYTLPYRALYNQHIADKINRLQNDTEKAKEFAEWSDIMRELHKEVGTMSVKYYFVSIFDNTRHVIRPGAVGRMLMLVAERYWIGVKESTKHPGQAIIMGFMFVFVVICGVLTLAVYQIAVFEYLIVMTIGCPLLAFMMWDGTKFIAEKLLGVLFSLIIKLMVMTFCMMLVISGYLDLVANMPYSQGVTVDEICKVIGLIILYLTLVMIAPNVASVIFSGVPSVGYKYTKVMSAAAITGGLAAATAGLGLTVGLAPAAMIGGMMVPGGGMAGMAAYSAISMAGGAAMAGGGALVVGGMAMEKKTGADQEKGSGSSLGNAAIGTAMGAVTGGPVGGVLGALSGLGGSKSSDSSGAGETSKRIPKSSGSSGKSIPKK